MKNLFLLRLSVASAIVAAGASETFAQGPLTRAPHLPEPIVEKAKTIPALKIPNGLLAAAIEELGRALQVADLPEMNVILAPEARNIKAPELLLRNVSGPDALRLIAVSAGCEVDPVEGAGGDVIGYRIFPAGGAIAQLPPPSPGPSEHAHPGILHESHEVVGAGGPPGLGGGTPAPGSGMMQPGPNPFGQGMGEAGAYSPPGGVMAFTGGVGGMAPAGESMVRVYSLGDITKTIKFPDVEATLRDILKAGGVSAEAAKLALHERTNVLVVTGSFSTQELVSQYLSALQKNAAMAAQDESRSASRRQELLEAKMQLDAEQEQRKRLSMQLEEAEARLRDTLRELDRIKNSSPKSP